VPAERARELGLAEGEGLYVHSSHPGTIAHLLGIGAGDVLLALDGQALASAADITVRMRARGAASELNAVWIDAQGEKHDRTWHPSEGARRDEGDGSAPPPNLLEPGGRKR
jgi:S1-C subfamily serine protease